MQLTWGQSQLTRGHVCLAGTFVFLLLYTAIIINHVGLGGGEIVTGYGVPGLLLLMLAIYAVLPGSRDGAESARTR